MNEFEKQEPIHASEDQEIKDTSAAFLAGEEDLGQPPHAFKRSREELTLQEVAQELVAQLTARRFGAFRTTASEYNPADIAQMFDFIPEALHTRAFRLLTKEQAAEVFVCLDSDRQAHIIAAFTDQELSDMLDEMYLDDTVDLIEEMPANVVKRILRNSTAGDRQAINRLLNYPKDSAGSIMTTEYVRFVRTMTVEAALSHIRAVAIDKETIYTCYITDRNRRLEGIVTAKQLLISRPDTLLSDIMTEHVISAHTHDEREEVARMFDHYGFLALPVVDGEERLVGIVTVDDAVSVLREETEEDFSKMAGMAPVQEGYLRATTVSLFLARIPWLLFLMISATFSGMILHSFEAALPAVLILFVPMLMGTGGNCGGQSSTTLIRGISCGEVEFSDFFRVLWKELRVAVLCGVCLALVSFFKVLVFDGRILQNPAIDPMVALVVSTALLATVLLSKLIGCLLPLLAKRVGFDPAVMASPLITTLVDILSLLTYFGISRAMLGF